MALRVHNTLTRKREDFVPAQSKIVRIYTCGLTVYSRMHIGHARTYSFWDFFRRYLEYLGYHVLSVMNYTDIDDRIMKRASEEGRGCLDIVEEVIAQFRLDCHALKIKDSAIYTRATDFVDEQAAMVKALLDKGHAYVVNGEVLYEVGTFDGYGKLSGQKLEESETGASGRVDEDFSRKRHPADFTLWKPSDPGQPSWSTGEAEWPSGRPGWHIECSAMSSATLGSHFDVHGGAVDNKFPHHENEIAQSEPICGSPWVRYWMHPEHLDLRGEKMSKSIGNVIGIPALLERFSPEEVRWFFCSNHYRSKLSFSEDLLAQSAEGFRKIEKLVQILDSRLSALSPEDRGQSFVGQSLVGQYRSLREEPEATPRRRHAYVHGAYAKATETFLRDFRASLDDDLNTPEASAAIFGYVNSLYAEGIEGSSDWPSVLAAYQCLTRHLHVFGIEFPNAELHPELAADSFPASGASEEAEPMRAFIDRLLELRAEARVAKDFEKSDRIRDLLAEAGLEVEDTKDGPRWSL